jgi:hypothetical protein
MAERRGSIGNLGSNAAKALVAAEKAKAAANAAAAAKTSIKHAPGMQLAPSPPSQSAVVLPAPLTRQGFIDQAAATPDSRAGFLTLGSALKAIENSAARLTGASKGGRRRRRHTKKHRSRKTKRSRK